EYLKKRSFDLETIEKFQLGLAPSQWDGLIKFFEKKGVKVQELVELGLALPNKKGTSYYDRFRNRIMFPIWNNVGRVIAFGGRVMDSSLPKYLNSPDTPLFNKSKNLYGIHLAKNNIRNEDLALIVEGYLDVIACHQYGINNVVASLGTAFTREQAKLLMQHTYQIAIIYDGDTAGSKATLRGLDILSQLGCDVRVVSLPQGQDPDDYLRNNGPKKLRELIVQSQGLIEYKLIKTMENVNVSTIIGKTKVVEDMAADLLAIKSPLARSEAIKIVSDKTGIPETIILAELKKFNSSTPKYQRLNVKKPEKKLEINKTQVQLVKILFEDNSLLEEVEQAGGRELFDQPVKDIYDQMYLALKTKGQVLSSDLDENNSKILAAALLEEAPVIEHQKAAADYIKILKLNKLNRDYAVKKKELKEAESKKDVTKQVELLLQLDEILQQKKLLTP
ncbi:MAG: DNA primase, partial [Clostridia bacterium]|nr:DNA primase [Clostridia bacterium]